jgi:diguanylate cyclase (GGDEF)-like protein
MARDLEQPLDIHPEAIIPASQFEVDQLGPTEPWPDATIVQHTAYETGYNSARRFFAAQEMAQLAMYDELTGAFNRWGMREQYLGIERRGRAEGGRTYLLLTDVDDFASINNNYGHPVGDQVLNRVVAVMRSMVRETDIAARLGGDEFALILPNITTKRAREIAEAIRNETRRSTPVTVSIGIGDVALSASLDGAIQRIDQALYAAKGKGGDQIVDADEPVEESA